MVTDNPYRAIPSISELAGVVDSTSMHGESLITFLQSFLDRQRERIRGGDMATREEIVRRANAEINGFARAKLSPVVNATGVVIHTNLGRAPVSAETAAAMSAAASNSVALEIDPESNTRGGRMQEIAALMRTLTGAQATLVVNNNAAAILLVLSTLASGRSVIVSRGEAVEIGGGFRIPDVLRQSGAHLVEVGTTNRTYPRDYEDAIDETTAVLLKVHASNFRISGFAESTPVARLAQIARRNSVPIVEDLGSGALVDTTLFGLDREPMIGESISNGAAVVTASGDKLLGGPQAGIIAGQAESIEVIERHPLARAVRADKTCLAGIAATLRHYVRGEATSAIPIWRMISTSTPALRDRADKIQSRLAGASLPNQVVSTMSTIGGGSLPGQQQPSVAIAIESRSCSVEELATRLRTATPGVFGRIDNGRLLLDLRTVLPELDDTLVEVIVAAAS